MGTGALLGVVVPLAQQAIEEVGVGAEAATHTDRDKDASVADEAVKVR